MKNSRPSIPALYGSPVPASFDDSREGDWMTPPTGSDACVEDLNDREAQDGEQRPPTSLVLASVDDEHVDNI